ncbi:hypothetical protein [Paenibacillus puldeungensis]|uniref:hypothetical protein n=1 Tax=Paenibacillus puldeungensis TaxID=696536 RepID=UPI0036D35E49
MDGSYWQKNHARAGKETPVYGFDRLSFSPYLFAFLVGLMLSAWLQLARNLTDLSRTKQQTYHRLADYLL